MKYTQTSIKTSDLIIPEVGITVIYRPIIYINNNHLILQVSRHAHRCQNTVLLLYIKICVHLEKTILKTSLVYLCNIKLNRIVNNLTKMCIINNFIMLYHLIFIFHLSVRMSQRSQTSSI